MVKVYSLKKQGALTLPGGLRVAQFACGGEDEVWIDDGLAELLASMSGMLGRAPCIVSGYRTERHNRINGGSRHSPHTLGIAADVRFGGADLYDVAATAERAMPESGGIGYHVGKYVHVDVRPERARWRQDGMGGPDVRVDGFYAQRASAPVRPILRKGDSGEAVLLIQGILAVECDGVYGPRTEEAVRAFQALYGLEQSGAIDARTYQALGLKCAMRTARTAPLAFCGQKEGVAV